MPQLGPGTTTCSAVLTRTSHVVRPAEESRDDELLATGFVAGDERCVEAVYRCWGSLVHTLARRALGDDHEAEDVTQQVFLAAWRGRHGYRPGQGGLAGWLVGITRHKTADALAARARRAELVAAASTRYERSPRPAPAAARTKRSTVSSSRRSWNGSRRLSDAWWALLSTATSHRRRSRTARACPWER